MTHGGWRILGKLSGSQIPIHYDPRNYQNGYGDILTFYREIYTRDDPIKLWWSENSLRYLEQEDTISRAICSLPAGKAIGPDHLALDSIPQGYLFWWTRTHLRQLLTQPTLKVHTVRALILSKLSRGQIPAPKDTRMIAVSGVALRIIDALWFVEFAQRLDRSIGDYQHGFRKCCSTHSNL